MIIHTNMHARKRTRTHTHTHTHAHTHIYIYIYIYIHMLHDKAFTDNISNIILFLFRFHSKSLNVMLFSIHNTRSHLIHCQYFKFDLRHSILLPNRNHNTKKNRKKSASFPIIRFRSGQSIAAFPTSALLSYVVYCENVLL